MKNFTSLSLLLSLLFLLFGNGNTSPCPGSFPTSSYNMTINNMDFIQKIWVDSVSGMTRQDFIYPTKVVSVILKGEIRYNIINSRLVKVDPPVCYYCGKDRDGFFYWATPVMDELLEDVDYTINETPAITCLGHQPGHSGSKAYFFSKNPPYTPLGTITGFWSDIVAYRHLEISNNGQPSSIFDYPSQCVNSSVLSQN